MDQLRLLWNLQELDDELNQLVNNFKELKKGENVKKLELRIKQLESDISSFRTQIDLDSDKIRRHCMKVDEFNYKSKELEDKLYSGDITDLNQIQHMKNEIGTLKQFVEDLESETLSLMEKVEHMKENIVQLENTHKKYKKDIQSARDLLRKEIEELNNEIAVKKELRTKSLEHIDDDLLTRYQSLRTRKGRAIASVAEDKCTGCHMNIPLKIVSKLKKSDSIYFCDNCDRILFYTKE